MIWFEMSYNKHKIPILEKKEKVQETDKKEEENERNDLYFFNKSKYKDGND